VKVFDTSALLAFVRREAGAAVVQDSLGLPEDNLVSAVTWAEIVAIAARYQVSIQPLAELVTVVPFGAADAAASQMFLRKDVSLGDRCCLATALSYKVPVVTADGAWTALFGHFVTVEQIR